MSKHKNQIAILFSTILMFSIITAIFIVPNAGQVYPPPGTKIPTYAFLNVAPNPIGVGQPVSINFFLATPMQTGENPIGMTVIRTNPDGT
ncbi:MAG: hypothetical protein LBQ98_00910, partial [Nitrososphaerota archaeon]|nr:hypothetical protein [Nitrososphaerota archaeon]